MGNLDTALTMHEKALLLSTEINDKHGIRKYLNNTGLIFEEKANFEKAMDVYAQCLNLSKQMNEKRSICVSYCNIGYILDYQGSLKQSLKQVEWPTGTKPTTPEIMIFVFGIQKKLGWNGCPMALPSIALDFIEKDTEHSKRRHERPQHPRHPVLQ